MAEICYVDLDDFCESNHSLQLLAKLKDEIPRFRVTLFTIPALCSSSFLREAKSIDWVDLVPHGWRHPHSRECQDWDYPRSIAYLDAIECYGLTRGFKAPGWQIADAMYQALLERRYWVADQPYNDARRPKELPVYLLDSGAKIHGHIGHLGGHNANELSLIMPDILKLREQEFGFVKDALAIQP